MLLSRSSSGCHADQEQFWVGGPDGVEWEVHGLSHDIEDDDGGASSMARPLPMARADGGRS